MRDGSVRDLVGQGRHECQELTSISEGLKARQMIALDQSSNKSFKP